MLGKTTCIRIPLSETFTDPSAIRLLYAMLMSKPLPGHRDKYLEFEVASPAAKSETIVLYLREYLCQYPALACKLD